MASYFGSIKQSISPTQLVISSISCTDAVPEEIVKEMLTQELLKQVLPYVELTREINHMDGSYNYKAGLKVTNMSITEVVSNQFEYKGNWYTRTDIEKALSSHFVEDFI